MWSFCALLVGSQVQYYSHTLTIPTPGQPLCSSTELLDGSFGNRSSSQYTAMAVSLVEHVCIALARACRLLSELIQKA